MPEPPLRNMRIADMAPLVDAWIRQRDETRLHAVLRVLRNRTTSAAERLEGRVREAIAEIERTRSSGSPREHRITTGDTRDNARPFEGDLSWLHERVRRREGQVRFRFGEQQIRDFLGAVSGALDPYGAEPDAAKWFRLRRAAERLALRPGFEELIALDANTIDELPHQTDTAIRVLREMSGRALLADEVGLGKTIEAGLILKELLARRLVKSVLILCPASLVDQWQEEMSEKFFLEFDTVQDQSDWKSHDLLVASHSRARHAANRPYVTARSWDVVIVDEAHKAKNHRTALYQMLQKLTRDFLLLLTATPLQNDLREFYNLVTLLRPGQFGTWKEFKRRYMGSDPRVPRDPTGIRDVAAQVMVRNKRANVNLHLPPRRPHRPEIRLEAAEQALYTEVTAFLRELYAVGMYPDAAAAGGAHFVLTMMAQRICSSSQAIAASLHRLSKRQAVRPRFRRRAGDLADQAKAVTTHSKLRGLDAVLRAHEGERIVVFSEHRPTIDLIKHHLKAKGITVFPYHGGVDRARRARLKLRFRETPGSVLLSSRSGAEGLNLQFAHVLVNYELPWNPLLVEQRIGRLHRIGQKREVVIYNFAATGTVEDRILQVLQDKIRLFELVVGELDLILGRFDDASDLEKRFLDAWLSASSDEAFEREVRTIEQEVERSYAEGKEAEERSSYIAPEDNAERLEREFGVLSIPARVRLAYGTRLMNLVAGVEAERLSLGLAASEIQEALRLAPVPDGIEPAEVTDYGPTVWIHSATGRARGVSLLVAADRLPVTLLKIHADREAPLSDETDRIVTGAWAP